MIALLTNLTLAEQELADVIRLFFGMEPIVYSVEDDVVYQLVIDHHHLETSDGWEEGYHISHADIENLTFTHREDPGIMQDDIERKRKLRRSSKLGLYHALQKLTDKHLPWGALTGIRPTRLYRQLAKECGSEGTRVMLKDRFQVSDIKYKLIESVIEAQQGIYTERDDEHVDLYVGIPFCPTRCLYCSFISFDLSKRKAPLEEYVKAVLKELDWFQSYLDSTGKKLRSIYVGGGTPTSIDLDLLSSILERIQQLKEDDMELTVEAGRADTITDLTFKRFIDLGVNRISINAQTMNDETLKAMNRPHTAQEVIERVHQAKAYPFDSINMDLIMGLPNEKIAHAEHTLSLVKTLPIDNLTVHTLAIKRSSKLKERIDEYNLDDIFSVERMVELSQETATQMGMRPYYMYRQKFMSGNLENVGFALPNKESIYNIDIMEETHNVIALGAGGVSKRMYYDEERHVRLANPKSIEHYLKNIDTLIDKKEIFFK